MQQSISKFFLPKKKALPIDSSISTSSPPVISSNSTPQYIKHKSKSTDIVVVDLESDSNEQTATSQCRSQNVNDDFDPYEFLKKRTASAIMDDNVHQSNKFRRIIMGVGRNMIQSGEESFLFDQNESHMFPQQDTSSISKITYTPLEKQVFSIREKYSDSLLMVECGYRMRFFGEDATTAASVLGVWAHKDHNFMVASVPTHRAVFHCRRLLSAGLKVAIVRQTETAAIRKSSKGPSSQTFGRSVAGVFTAGTLVDDDDPAFDGLIGSSSMSMKSRDDNGNSDDDNDDEGDEGLETTHNSQDATDDDNQDHWIASYFEHSIPSASSSFANSNRDIIDLSTLDVCAGDKIGALVAVCVRAHQVWVRSFALDTVHQSLVDFLDMLKPAEIVASESISTVSRDIILSYLNQSQRIQQQHPSTAMAEGDSSSSPSSSIMKRLKWFSSRVYRSTDTSNAPLWSRTISQTAQSALMALNEYLQEFQLEGSLESPQVNIHETFQSNKVNIDNQVSDLSPPLSHETKCTKLEISDLHSISERSFPLDGVTVRDLELFDSFSNANETLRGMSKILRYQQQYFFHQQHHLHRTPDAGRRISNVLPGGLFNLLDHCKSIYGRRTLKSWLLNPLCEVPAIIARQEAITWLLPAFSPSADIAVFHAQHKSISPVVLRTEVEKFVHRIQETLKKTPDIEKMLTSLQFNRIAPARLKVLLQLAIRLRALHVAEQQQQQLDENDEDINSSREETSESPLLMSSSSSLLTTYLPKWLKRHLSRTNFNTLAETAHTYDQRIIVTSVSPFSAASHATDYDPQRLASESLTGFFDAQTENSFPTLVALREEKHQIETSIYRELQQIRTILHKPQLRFTLLRNGPLSCIEHLIELPLAEEKKAPAHWIRVNATKQVVRFHVPTVVSLQEQLYRVRDECKIAGKEAWRSFVSEVKTAVYSSLRIAISVLGALDAMLSLTHTAAQPGYICPRYEDTDDQNNMRAIHIMEGRHPVLEKRFADSHSHAPYLANDIHLQQYCCPPSSHRSSADVPTSRNDAAERLIQIVTGPNMGGKSSYCRMVAMIALLGQIGSYVPARSANMVVFDNILTRMGSEDDLQSGRSTFLCELVRTNTILRYATARSLVIIDELGRGTATYDGYAIAQATLWYLLDHIRCFTLFITHFPHIMQCPRPRLRPSTNMITKTNEGQEQAPNGDPKVILSHMSYLEQIIDATTGEADITFLYKLVETPARGSYGINVARLAGMKKSVLDRAMVKAREMHQPTATLSIADT